jgi:hypothetical protein
MLQAALKRKLASESDRVHPARVLSLKAVFNVWKGEGGEETLGARAS